MFPDSGKGLAVDRGGPQSLYGLHVGCATVSLVGGKAVAGPGAVKLQHQTVPGHLGDYGGCGYGYAEGITFFYSFLWDG